MKGRSLVWFKRIIIFHVLGSERERVLKMMNVLLAGDDAVEEKSIPDFPRPLLVAADAIASALLTKNWRKRLLGTWQLAEPEL